MNRHKEPEPLPKPRKLHFKELSLVIYIKSAFLMTASFIFLGVGLSNYSEGNYFNMMVFLAFSLILFMPGSFHLFLQIQIYRGAPGYKETMLTELDY